MPCAVQREVESARRAGRFKARLHASRVDRRSRAARVWDRHLLRAAAAERLAADLDAWDGQLARLRLRGSDRSRGAPKRCRHGRHGPLPTNPAAGVRGSATRRRSSTARVVARGADPALRRRRTPGACARRAGALVQQKSRRPRGSGPFFEGAGSRGTLELVGEEILQLREGTAPAGRRDRAGAERWRARRPRSNAGIPYAADAERTWRFGQTA
jgi:hypothetical protein